jgi:Flp pilus assembly protein TadD
VPPGLASVEPPAGVAFSSVATNPAVWTSVALVVITVAVFAALRHFDFIGLDDPGYVRTNPHLAGGLSWPDIKWAWTTGFAANWHPLTWLSYMLDIELFGLRPGGHHMVSVVLHVVNTLLLFEWLRRATGTLGRSAFVAALFSVHPLHVESVAWIAERKDVLSTMFWLLTMIAYLAYVRRPRWDRYVLVCLGLALGLMAKPMLVTLPFVLLLLDVWPLERVHRAGISRLLFEKIPLFALAAGSSAITFIVQRQGGAVTGLGLLPLSTRIVNAVVAYVRYLGKAVWPTDLTLFYPYSESLPAWWVAGSLLALVAITAVAIRAGRRHPYLAVGWLWYLGTLVPVIGLVQVGTQAIADRYTYVPLIGIFMAMAWGVADLTSRWPARRWALPAAAGISVLACAVTARAQVQVWQNNWTVWTHALAATQGNYVAENAIGVMLVEQGKHEEALPHFEASSRMKPEYVEARNNLGLAYTRIGRIADAIAQFTLAVQLRPEIPESHDKLGFALMSTGRTDEALTHFLEAVRLKPDFADAQGHLGFVLAAGGRVTEAIPHFQEAVRLDPNSELARLYLGVALGAAGRLDDAVQQFHEALRINPKSPGAQAEIDKIAAMKKGRGGGD